MTNKGLGVPGVSLFHFETIGQMDLDKFFKISPQNEAKK